jgi:DNA repair exonuclease SbcCD nuclease subunit
MADHKQPTKAELQAEAQKALDELETPPSEPVPSEPAPTGEIAPSEPIPSEPIPSEPAPSEPIPEEKPTQQEIDYKKRYADSTREAQILHEKNKSLVDAYDEANKIEVTEEDLQKEYTDWDLMTDTEKRLAKDSLLSTRRFAIIHESNQKFKKVEDWNIKVDEYAQNPETLVKIPDLEGKLDEFKVFASKPSRVGVDFETLASAFLFDVDKLKKETPAKKGQMFEQGSGGVEKRKPGGDKLSVEEGRTLMNTDFNKYKEMLKAGKIEMPL